MHLTVENLFKRTEYIFWKTLFSISSKTLALLGSNAFYGSCISTSNKTILFICNWYKMQTSWKSCMGKKVLMFLDGISWSKLKFLAIYCNCYAWTYCEYKVWFWRVYKCKPSINISMGYYNALWLPLWPFNLLLVWSDKAKNCTTQIFDFWCVRNRILLRIVPIISFKNCLRIKNVVRVNSKE